MGNEETKWDKLYNPDKKSLFSKLEEFAINAYFSQAFTKSILSKLPLYSNQLVCVSKK